MEIKSKIFKRKSGKSKGKWVVRLNYFDYLTGKNRCIERLAEKRSEIADEHNRLID